VPKILIADDEEGLLELIRFSLNSSGFHVTAAKNGKQALELAQKEKFDQIEEKILSALKSAKEISMIGSGDPLLARSSQSIMAKLGRGQYPKLSILLQTNGLLFTRDWWSRHPDLHAFPIKMQVSIDAARPDTYARVRRGGKFESLLQNLVFIRELRASKHIRQLEFRFVVQAENFLEMKEFIGLGRKFHVDRVIFSRLRN
jgi:CheY-like chemotaxis protein